MGAVRLCEVGMLVYGDRVVRIGGGVGNGGGRAGYDDERVYSVAVPSVWYCRIWTMCESTHMTRRECSSRDRYLSDLSATVGHSLATYITQRGS